MGRPVDRSVNRLKLFSGTANLALSQVSRTVFRVVSQYCIETIYGFIFAKCPNLLYFNCHSFDCSYVVIFNYYRTTESLFFNFINQYSSCHLVNVIFKSNN